MSKEPTRLRRPTKRLSIYAYTDVSEITNYYREIIDDLLKQKKDVPAELITGFLSCFAWEGNKEKDEEERFQVYIKSKELFEKACKKFDNDDYFAFSVRESEEHSKGAAIKRTRKYELKPFLKWLAYDICFFTHYIPASKRRKEPLKRALTKIDQYFKQESVRQIVWPDRKRKIVAGFLIHELGYLGLSHTKEYSKKDIYLRVKNLLRPTKKAAKA